MNHIISRDSLLLLCTAAIAAASPPLRAQDLDRGALADIVEPILAEKQIPGCVIGLVVGDALAIREAFGQRDLATAQPMTTDTLFQIGSVSKPITATLVGLLAAHGDLTWDDTLAAHWPEEQELPEALGALTLRQLASHAAALPRNPVNRRDLEGSPSVMLPLSRDQLHAGLRDTALTGTPGTTWGYSNLGYAILGHVVERASGASYETALRRLLGTPLGLTDTGVQPTAAQEERLATCYWQGEAPTTPRARWQIGEICGFAGLFSSVDDLARLVALQYAADDNKSPLPLAAIRALHEPQIDLPGGRRMGLGWFVDEFPGVGRLYGHGGEVDGHSACIAAIPRARAGLVVLANMGGDSAEQLARALMAKAMPILLRR